MKKGIIILLIIKLQIFNLCSQNQNSNWLFGFKDTLYNETCGIYLWDETQTDISFRQIESPLNFESTMAAISDTMGNLLLYTNGCSIADSSHNIISNGTEINPGEIHDFVCDNTGYIIPNGAIFLSFPGNNEQYVLLHLGARYDSLRAIRNNILYYTLIEATKNGFEVIEKNHPILKGDIESFAVIKHGNGNDWWILVPEYNKNKYNRFLLNESGIEKKEPQFIGIELPDEQCKISGLSAFSPDGKKYIRFNNSCGYQLFDFNRCTGFLSNFIYESVGYFAHDLSANFTFTPDSKYILINKLKHTRFNPNNYQNNIYFIKIEDIGVKATPYELFESSYYIPWNRYYCSSIGNIYAIQNHSSDLVTEIINHKKPHKVNFTYYTLPVSNARTVPYFANFNLQKLDCSSVNTDELVQNTFEVYPNPVSNEITIKINDAIHDIQEINFSDISGHKLETIKVNDILKRYLLDVKKYKSGFYIIEVHSKNNAYFKKILKI